MAPTSRIERAGAVLTMGASASIMGLLGALAHYGSTSGSSLIRGEVKQYVIMFAVMGLLMPGTDNYAHAGGFLGGYAVSSFLKPLQRDRVEQEAERTAATIPHRQPISTGW